MIRSILADFFADEEPECPDSELMDTESIENVRELLEIARYVGYQALDREPGDQLLMDLMRFIQHTRMTRQNIVSQMKEAEVEDADLPVFKE